MLGLLYTLSCTCHYLRPPCLQAMVGEIVQHAGSGSEGTPGGVVFLLDGSGSVTEGETNHLQHLFLHSH